MFGLLKPLMLEKLLPRKSAPQRRFLNNNLFHTENLEERLLLAADIQILAAGVTGEEMMELQIDGVTVQTFSNIGGDAFNGIFETFNYTHASDVTADQIRVAFTNDGTAQSGVNRDLRVDKILIDGKAFESEAPTVTSVFPPDSGCSGGVLFSEFLFCTGHFQYADVAPADGSAIQILAAGETGTETLELQIDGVTVQTFNNIGGSFANDELVVLEYLSPTALTIDQIRVAFTNDGNAPGGQDRNVRIDGIFLDGVKFESESPAAFSVGSFNQATGCDGGFKLSEFLHCNGYFQYADIPENPGTLSLGATQFLVGEDADSVQVEVIRTGGSDGIATIDYTTVAASATPGTDYTETTGTVVFEDGETSKFVSVPILNDTTIEPDELFSFAIDKAGGGVFVGAPRTATIIIVDDDDVFGQVNLTRSSYTVNEDAATVTITVFRTKAGADAASVDYSVTAGTATAGSDFVLASGTLNFAEGEATATFEVAILEDALTESEESINLALTNPNGLILGQNSTAVLSIVDDDGTGTFFAENIVTGLIQPTAIDFGPDGLMFIAEKGGVVRVAQDGVLQQAPFIDISEIVNEARDRGLLGIAVHPDFTNNPYVYLSYTYDPPELATLPGLAAPDQSGNRVARVSRFTADVSNGSLTAVAGSELVILGTNSTFENISHPDQDSTENIDLPPSCGSDGTLENCIPVDSQSHAIAALEFGNDGMLYVSVGDGTSFGRVDPRTVRVQDIDSLSGKLLRIDPLTGAGLSDNPFYDGDPLSNRSKVVNYGLRNPFRFAIHPENGLPYIGDVGWSRWEEINVGVGQNFGWPFFEGGNGESLQTGGYEDLPEAQAFFASGETVAEPLIAFNHANGAVSVIAGDFYVGDRYPDILDNALFFTDFGEPTLRALVLNEDGTLQQTLTLMDNFSFIVEMSNGPDGFMYYVDITGSVGRIDFLSDHMVTSAFDSNTGALTIAATQASDIAVRSVDNDLQITINGVVDNSLGSITAASVKSISLEGSAGDDRIDLSGVTAVEFTNLTGTTVQGGDGNDTIIGSALDDRLIGGAGDDSILAGAGNDLLNGSFGNDTLFGEAGVDLIFGGSGLDILDGGADSDILKGQKDNDLLTGGAGNDTLEGGSGDDTLAGNQGNDSLIGGGGNDSLSGGELSELITGLIAGSGNDTIEGGDGDDQIVAGDGADKICAGDGNDFVNAGTGNDTVFGNAGNDLVFGGGGKDILIGGSGNDTLRGQGGLDTVAGGAGTDVVQGETIDEDFALFVEWCNDV